MIPSSVVTTYWFVFLTCVWTPIFELLVVCYQNSPPILCFHDSLHILGSFFHEISDLWRWQDYIKFVIIMESVCQYLWHHYHPHRRCRHHHLLLPLLLPPSTPPPPHVNSTLVLRTVDNAGTEDLKLPDVIPQLTEYWHGQTEVYTKNLKKRVNFSTFTEFCEDSWTWYSSLVADQPDLPNTSKWWGTLVVVTSSKLWGICYGDENIQQTGGQSLGRHIKYQYRLLL
jgi:hypothetical protein